MSLDLPPACGSNYSPPFKEGQGGEAVNHRHLLRWA